MSVSRIASAFELCVVCILLATGGCVAPPSPDAPNAYLDEVTAATVTAVGRPLVFARERPNFAVHMRDYITLAAASVDRSGKIDYVLIVYFWSTFDPHAQEGDAADRQPDELSILADDRRIPLVRLDRTAHEAGIEERADAPRVGGGLPTLYHTDPATLRFIAAARTLRAQTRISSTELEYDIWEDRRVALAEWLRHLDND